MSSSSSIIGSFSSSVGSNESSTQNKYKGRGGGELRKRNLNVTRKLIASPHVARLVGFGHVRTLAALLLYTPTIHFFAIPNQKPNLHHSHSLHADMATATQKLTEDELREVVQGPTEVEWRSVL